MSLTSDPLLNKKKTLFDILRRCESMAVAFSGGTDSTLLLAAARQCLGDRVIAVTAVSPLQPAREVHEAILFAKSLGTTHYTVHTREVESARFAENNENRCYICKKIIFTDLLALAAEHGIHIMAHAANRDDLEDYRPGMEAAKELGVVSPLIDAGLTKSEIRKLSRQMGLSTWNKPSGACLASRIPYGRPITAEALAMVEAAENVLTALGFSGLRVRHYGETAKIEVRPADFSRLLKPDRRLNIIGEFRKIGFLYITLDLEGYQTGRLNRSVLENKD